MKSIARIVITLLGIGFAGVSINCHHDAPPPEKVTITFTELQQQRKTISLISGSECELKDGNEILLGSYSRQQDKLRVVIQALGTQHVMYYVVIPDGLRDPQSKEIFLLQNAIPKVISEMLRSSDQNTQSNALQIVGKYDARSFEPELSNLILSDNPAIAQRAEQLIRDFDPHKANELLKQGLKSSNFSIQQRVANRLWAETRDRDARSILIASYEEAWRDPSSSINQWDVASKLQDFGYSDTRDILFECFRNPMLTTNERIQAAVAAIERNHDESAGQYLAKALDLYDPKHLPPNSYGDPLGFILKAIEHCKAKEAAPKLKLIAQERMNKGDNPPDDYLHALAVVDDPAWKTFPYFYHKGGWTEWRKILIDVEAIKKNDKFMGSKKNPFDGTSHPEKVQGFFDLLGIDDAFRGRHGLWIGKKYNVSILCPTKVDLNFQLVETERKWNELGEREFPKKQVFFHLLATGDPDRAWLVDDIAISDLDVASSQSGERTTTDAGRVVPALTGHVMDQADTRVKADFATIRAALTRYRNTGGYYPTTMQGLNALIEKPTSNPIPKMWERSFSTYPLDPWGNAYGYKYPGTIDKSEFEIISKGPDGIEGTPDDISSQAGSVVPAGGAGVVPPSPSPHYIYDGAGWLNEGDFRTLDDEIKSYERETTSQFVVAIFPKIPDGAEMFDFSQHVFEAWKPGLKGKDNGAIFFIFAAEHKVHIRTGRGMGGVLPDESCKQIIDNTVVPLLRKQDRAGAVTEGVRAMIAAAKARRPS
jgi:general secretion pathway protein G